MGLNENSDTTNFKPIHYVFVEKIGPFQETAQAAWQELHKGAPAIGEKNKITGYLSLYKIHPQMIYCAGVAVDSKPEKLPPGFKYMHFDGGKYMRFTLTGSYSQLPEACGRVFEIVKQKNVPMDDNFFIENYVNNPKDTPEDKLITEIMIPTK